MGKTNRAAWDLVNETARETGAGWYEPSNPNGGMGHAHFYASRETGKTIDAMLKCLAVLGVSRDPWQDTDNGGRKATLRDVDGTGYGTVRTHASNDSGTAELSYALSRPMACFGI